MFSPEKFDQEISLDQFNGQGLPLEQMQHLGIKASLIRQDLIERAQNVVEKFQIDLEANARYKAVLQKKLDNNIYGHERHYLKEAAKDLPSY